MVLQRRNATEEPIEVSRLGVSDYFGEIDYSPIAHYVYPIPGGLFGPTDFGGWSYRLTHVRSFVCSSVRLSGLFLNNRS